jgi:hypothetical protein
MPRNVRNFWVEGNVDGAKSPQGFGPRNKDGGLSLTIYQRNAGNVEVAVRIRGFAHSDGTLRLEIDAPRHGEGGGSFEIKTLR